MAESSDLLVIGGGIVGLATAHTYQLRHPGRVVTLLEKEPTVARHQTGRKSGVIHSGIYYKPGSMKATTCRRGIDLLVRFCDDNNVEYDRCGKVIVALDDAESARLDNIFERGQANGVTCELIDQSRLRELEPHVAGIRAIHVHDAGIVDYVGMCEALKSRIESGGGRVITGARAEAFSRTGSAAEVRTHDGRTFTAPKLVTCAGLHSDRIARASGHAPGAKIVPFRGEYYELVPEARSLVRNLIYPVPDPAFPFLGVHFTRMIERDASGHLVECGPNAVLAFAREGYTKSAVNLRDLASALTYPSFWRLALKHWRTGLGEIHRSWSKSAFTKALQRLIPEVEAKHLEPAPAGVRAQALAPGGKLVDDFKIVGDDRVVNVINAPSPAATASLAIAEHIVDRLG